MVYWRPICQLYDSDFKEGASDEAGSHEGRLPLMLAGMKGIGFSSVERLARGADGVWSQEMGMFAGDVDFDVVCARLTKRRRDIAGLTMDRAHIMGIVNVTPDSFSDGGAFESVGSAVEHGLRLLDEGASILDVGGESTRPGADVVRVEEELSRVIPVIEALRAQTNCVISIDTRKARVMEEAVLAGATMINDVSALGFDERSLQVATGLNVPVVLMHAQGDPGTMQKQPHYSHVLSEVYDYLKQRIDVALEAGIDETMLLVDPGIGFGKTTAHNCALLDGMSLFHGLGVPLLLGCSRKRFIGALSKDEGVNERLPGSLAGALKGAGQGVQILRVHDVAATRQALNVWFAPQRV